MTCEVLATTPGETWRRINFASSIGYGVTISSQHTSTSLQDGIAIPAAYVWLSGGVLHAAARGG